MAYLGTRLTAQRRVAVVGAGWAGCAAATELAAEGVNVILLEASDELGGRARRLPLELAGHRHVLDNGQHLLLGAYTETAALLQRLNVALDDVVERRPFELRYADGFRLQAARLPAPLHLAVALIAARGLAIEDRSTLIGFLRNLKRSRWNIGSDRNITEWLHECGQTAQVVRRLWRPLALASLNTPLDRASAQIFANVLRDSLGATGAASEMWLPRANLSALFPDAVERFVVVHGGEVRRDARVEHISVKEHSDRFVLLLRNEPERVDVDAVVYAAAPTHLKHIVGNSATLGSLYEALTRFEHEPIYTVYLKYGPDVRIARGFTALLDDAPKRRYAQWVFDRGAFDPANRGVLAAVISSSGPHEAEPLEDVCQAVAQQLTEDLRLPAPVDARAIADRRATLAAVPHLHRPCNRTPWSGFVLAGDWTESDYPSTLETAVRSGRAAARLLLNDH
ncbi:MAG TPA: hydroxysqualene dehydroxylase HpnE [Burkholderiaceae bacterium]|nr:hydroxysqualene dehydroxylase HpnE [Burkholderiaceae bacterium]